MALKGMTPVVFAEKSRLGDLQCSHTYQSTHLDIYLDKGETMNTSGGILISIIINMLVFAVVIYVVAKLNLGLSVRSFGTAFIAAIVISVVAAFINWLLGVLGIKISLSGSLLNIIIYLIVTAIILLISDRLLTGFAVNGFVGAVIATIAIAIVSWLVSLLLGALGINFATPL